MMNVSNLETICTLVGYIIPRMKLYVKGSDCYSYDAVVQLRNEIKRSLNQRLNVKYLLT